MKYIYFLFNKYEDLYIKVLELFYQQLFFYQQKS